MSSVSERFCKLLFELNVFKGSWTRWTFKLLLRIKHWVNWLNLLIQATRIEICKIFSRDEITAQTHSNRANWIGKLLIQLHRLNCLIQMKSEKCQLSPFKLCHEFNFAPNGRKVEK